MSFGKLLLSTIAGVGVAAMMTSTAMSAPVAVQDAAGGDGVFLSPALVSTVGLSTDGGVSYGPLRAGVFGLELSTSAPTFASDTFTSFITYCFEVGQFLALPTTYESQALATSLASNVPAQPSAAAAAVKIARLWLQRFAISVSETDTNFEGVVGATAAERSAAFQVAIWDIAVDNADGLGTGVFQTAAGGPGSGQARINELAGKYLAIASDTSITTIANLDSLYHPTAQNLILARGGSTGVDDPVPAPATLVLFGAGLVALAAMRRKTNA